jgi:outer membrane protein insertion porin family
VHEGKVAYLGKIDFVGNTFTRDHVLRREWFLREGDRLSSTRLEDSIKRMRQLGLVDISEMPKFEPQADDPTKINLTVRVKELHRQMINFNFGYSGYDGLFIALGYSTKNFLGMGETLAINFQHGERAKNYRFAFTEPRLFHLPANAGIDVFKTEFEYPLMYTRKGQGFNVMTSARFWRYFGLNLGYRLEFVEIADVHPNISSQNSYYLSFYGEGGQTISSIMPTLYYNTIDSPLFPTSGMKVQLDYRYSGGIFGGDVNMHKYTLKFIKFLPLKNRTTFGMQFVYQGLTNFGDRPIPYWEKFFLGGERSIRGFYVYRVGPKNDMGYVIGGTKAFHANFEFHLPLTEQLTFITFYDVGNAYDAGVPLSLDDVYQSMGVELKVFIPMLNIPFRLIFAYNPRLVYESENHFAFMLGVGPSFY